LLPLRSGLKDDQNSGATGRPDNKKYIQFGELIIGRFALLLRKLGAWSKENVVHRSFGIRSQNDLNREAKLFRRAIDESIFGASRRGLTSRVGNPLFWNLRNAFIRGDTPGLDRELKYSFQSFILRTRFSKAVTDNHRRLADFRAPYDWYPVTRSMQRTIHRHVGPTNSGKTYNALKALENAKTGIYAGPLRLLAHEVYSRFKAKGLPCALVTGEEQRLPERQHKFFTSCTVEMSPLGTAVDVAVIDEIQMIASDERGWAWMAAVLGIQARELHLCGEERAVDLIQNLAARIGDKCIVHRYERLNPLYTMAESLQGDFSNLQKGDCVVSFTRVGLHTLRREIEQATGRRCAIVYGSLPPETRAQQAALFNDPDNEYDFLVASDAIGMGLNLEIKRVIFESVTKWDGGGFRSLSVSEVKQIGGRAGRYRTASKDIMESVGGDGDGDGSTLALAAAEDPALRTGASEAPPAGNGGSFGLITTLDDEDLNHIRQAFTKEVEPLRTGGLLAPTVILEQFLSNFPPDTPVSFILARMREMARVSDNFQLCNIAHMLEVADVLQDLPLNTHDRIIFLTAPVTLAQHGQREVLRSLARTVAELKVGHLLDIEGIDLDVLDAEPSSGNAAYDYLGRLEALHKALTLYLWLTYRYEGVFVSQYLAFHVKSLVEDKITGHLDNLGVSAEVRKARRETKRRLAEMQIKKAERLLGEATPRDHVIRKWDEGGDEEAPAGEGDEDVAADGPSQGNVMPDDGPGTSGGDAARV